MLESAPAISRIVVFDQVRDLPTQVLPFLFFADCQYLQNCCPISHAVPFFTHSRQHLNHASISISLHTRTMSTRNPTGARGQSSTKSTLTKPLRVPPTTPPPPETPRSLLQGLPPELQLEIISYLHLIALATFKQTCKQYDNFIIIDDALVHKHLKRVAQSHGEVVSRKELSDEEKRPLYLVAERSIIPVIQYYVYRQSAAPPGGLTKVWRKATRELFVHRFMCPCPGLTVESDGSLNGDRLKEWESKLPWLRPWLLWAPRLSAPVEEDGTESGSE